MAIRTEHDLRDAMAALAAGQETAIQSIYKLTAARLYGKLLALLKTPPLAQRALCATYLRLWQMRGQITTSAGDDFQFIASIAHRCALDIRFNSEGSGSTSGSLAGGGSYRKEKSEGISLHLLDDRDRDMLTAAYLEFDSVELIAQRFGLDPDDVRTRLAKLTAPGGDSHD